MWLKKLLMCLVIVALAGCLNDDDDKGFPQLEDINNTSELDDNRDRDVSTTSGLNGIWITPKCTVMDDGGSYDGGVIIDGTEWIHIIRAYDDTDCFSSTMEIVHEILTISGNKVTLSNGEVVTQIDDLTTGKFTTPLRNDVAIYFNDISKCGITTWEVGVTRDVSQCNEMVGTHTYDIYQIKNNRLYSGLETEANDGETPEARPDELNYEDYLVRQR